jgi:hypothetical protein
MAIGISKKEQLLQTTIALLRVDLKSITKQSMRDDIEKIIKRKETELQLVKKGLDVYGK